MYTDSQTADQLKKENALLMGQIAALQNRFENKIEELSLISELGMGLLSVNDFERACAFITATIINSTVAQNCSIMLFDREEGRLFLVSATDHEGKKYSLPAKNIISKKALIYSFKMGQGEAGHAMSERTHVFVSDVHSSPYFDTNHACSIQIGSLLSIPLMVEHEPVGVINLSHADPNAFPSDSVYIFNIAANYVAISLQNTLNFEKLNIEIAKRKRVERALRDVHEDLEQRIQERTGALAKANEQLKNEIIERKYAQTDALEAKDLAERANRTKTEFLANMSHELRTPLNHIIGFTELVVDNQLGDLNDQQREFLNDVLFSGNHLLSLINDILDLSKVEAGKLKLEISEIDLRSLLTNSLNMIREKALKNGIRLTSTIKDIPERVFLDERKMKQIIYNLLSNAAKFTPNGGQIQLSARTIAGVVRSGKRRDDDKDFKIIQHMSVEDLGRHEFVDKCIEFSVTDTGMGITEENQACIFNAFEQGDSSATRQYEGTGLGLSLTKKLVELHGGKIWVESEGEGKGSTFRFVIPV